MYINYFHYFNYLLFFIINLIKIFYNQILLIFIFFNKICFISSINYYKKSLPILLIKLLIFAISYSFNNYLKFKINKPIENISVNS